IRRALESVPADAKASADGALKGLIDGIELTERDLAKTLEPGSGSGHRLRAGGGRFGGYRCGPERAG
ncbi:hypothetical protein MKK84_25515, partial [Methylobacterium sp. E-065]|nr:hypothetical protein [Methylobacterium sp. E-065]